MQKEHRRDRDHKGIGQFLQVSSRWGESSDKRDAWLDVDRREVATNSLLRRLHPNRSGQCGTAHETHWGSPGQGKTIHPFLSETCWLFAPQHPADRCWHKQVEGGKFTVASDAIEDQEDVHMPGVSIHDDRETSCRIRVKWCAAEASRAQQLKGDCWTITDKLHANSKLELVPYCWTSTEVEQGGKRGRSRDGLRFIIQSWLDFTRRPVKCKFQTPAAIDGHSWTLGRSRVGQSRIRWNNNDHHWFNRKSLERWRLV